MSEDQDGGRLSAQDGHPQPIAVRPGGAPPISPPRLSVVEMAYHQHAGEAPTNLLDDEGVRYEVDLLSDEQPYVRRRTVGESWEPLDAGWIVDAGLLLLRNDEGRFDANPTPEQLEEMIARVIELTFDLCLNPSDSPLLGYDPGSCKILVPPRQTCRFRPGGLDRMRVRCARGTARYTLCLVPR